MLMLREALHASAGKKAREKLKALKDAYLSHRQVGLSEAVYEVNPSLRMKDSNISCLFVMTGFPKNRSVFQRKVSENNEKDEDQNEDEIDEEETSHEQPSTSKKVKIEGRPGTYVESITLIDRYKARPGHLEDMCLAHFAMSYVYTSKVPEQTCFDDDGCSNEFSNQEIFETEVRDSKQFYNVFQ